jgi:FkbM family methyltransferase
MLIPLQFLLDKYSIHITGILHVGAHECEELQSYVRCGVNKNDVYWVEGNEVIYSKMKAYDIPNLIHALIDSDDGKDVVFNISNNGQSSSILEFGTHSSHHPHVKYVETRSYKTKRLDTLIDEHKIPIEKTNFINLDIQGVELRALKSMEKYLHHLDYIYTEVNRDYVYKNCNLIGEIDEYLEKFNFKRVETNFCENFGWGDAFYIKQ